MASDRLTPPEYLGTAADYDPHSEEFAELRELLLGAERRKLAELERRVDDQEPTAEELAEKLPEAIALRAGRDQQLARAMAPMIDEALSENIRRNPQDIATAIFPVLGPAIRKALAEAMAALVESINRAVEHTFSVRGMRWRIEAWRTGTPYAQVVIKHALVYRVEQVFLIHAETGLLLHHVAPPELKVTDADLISGMLTAIQDFVADSFRQQEGGRLRRFSVGELTVLVEPGPRAVMAAVVRGQPPEALRSKLQDRLETVHLEFAAAFADFAGDSTPFVPARPLLEDCLETVLNTDRTRASRGRFAWLRWAGPVFALLVLLLVLSVRSQRRWNAAVARLRAEPGIEIVSASRSRGTWRLRGLKDPLAAEPAVILAGLGADTADLEAHWTPFLSLEPELVVARAAQLLRAPADVRFRLSHDTLAATGSAPLEWLGQSAAVRGLPPGVLVLDLSGVTPVLPPALAALGGSIEDMLVLFEIGSAQLSGAGPGAVDRVAGALQRLRAETGVLGFRVELELFGRTDATGTDAANQSLSRSRVDVVRASLLRRGVPAAALRAVALGTAQPIAARGGLDAARANRSVAFAVRLRPSLETSR